MRRKKFFPSARKRRRKVIAIGTRQLKGRRTIEQEKTLKVARAHARKVVDAQVEAVSKQKLQPDTIYMTQKDWDDIKMWTDEA